jgi:DNA modification methylase
MKTKRVDIRLGDCIAEMKSMADNSVDSIVSDPPYELGFMGKSWDSTGIANSVKMWSEALRVLKPGGHLLAFSGSRTYHRMTCAIEDAGFEIRDQIMWVYGSGFPKSHNVSLGIDKAAGHANRGRAIPVASKFQASDVEELNKLTSNPVDTYESRSPEAKQWEGWGTALKPAHEPIVLARKPLIGTVANNILTYGVGGLNIGGSRVGSEERTYNLTMTSGNFETTTGGKNEKSGTATVSGRFPANFLHDGSDEVIDLLGDAARFFYCSKPSKRDRNEGLDKLPTKGKVFSGQGGASAGNAEGSVEDKFTTQPAANFHPTVKPTDLMRYLCRLITPPNGTVLDPFMGSGSTGKAAVLEGFKFIGIDMTPEYHPIAKARIKWAQDEVKRIAEEAKQLDLTTHKPNAATVVGMKQKKAPVKKAPVKKVPVKKVPVKKVPAAGLARATNSVNGLKCLTEQEREEIVEFRLLGISVRDVAKKVNCAPATVVEVFKKHLQDVRAHFIDESEDARADIIRRLEGIADRSRRAYAEAEDRDKPRFLAEERQALAALSKITGLAWPPLHHTLGREREAPLDHQGHMSQDGLGNSRTLS